ncbi:MAG: hypothetical protein HRT70_01330 [Flavobacteriaceae bacterium]|nr:hypothetical protein [Flavobacteriaceae bacterium]
MAKVKVPKTSTFINSFEKKLKQNIARADKSGIEAEIIATILQGRSPVRGEKFVDYSIPYANRFKGGSRRPVDMLRTGRMLKSLKVTQSRGKLGILIKFNDPVAAFHDISGAAGKVIRRLLPREGEQFKENISRLIRSFFKNNVRKSTR